MSEVTWGQLAKAVADLTKISEEIDAKILTHNEDESAHSQSNEAIYNHRIAEILDHLDDSITPAKIAANFTYIAQAQKDDDQAIIGDNVFYNISDLYLEGVASKETKILLLAFIYTDCGGWDAEPIIRFKWVDTSGTHYFPSTGGFMVPQSKNADVYWESFNTYAHLITVPAGEFNIYVQAARSSPDETVHIRGYNDYTRSSLIILSVGAEITEP